MTVKCPACGQPVNLTQGACLQCGEVIKPKQGQGALAVSR